MVTEQLHFDLFNLNGYPQENSGQPDGTQARAKEIVLNSFVKAGVSNKIELSVLIPYCHVVLSCRVTLGAAQLSFQRDTCCAQLLCMCLQLTSRLLMWFLCLFQCFLLGGDAPDSLITWNLR